MASVPVCPSCGSALREIVWGYGTIADVEDAGDVVIGGCVIDVDEGGRVAAMQCPACGTRTDAAGIALEAQQPPATTEHPFDVSFSSPPRERWEVTMTDPGPRSGQQQPQGSTEGTTPFVDDDFGGEAARDAWRYRVEPYASHDDALPPPSAPTPERVEPYASRDDAVPAGGAATPDRVQPYASREHDLPPASAPGRDRVDPYASRDDRLPEAGGGWRERVEPFAAGSEAAAGGLPADPAGEAAPAEALPDPVLDAVVDASPTRLGEQLDARWSYTSDFTDAEEEGWPPGSRDDD